MAWREKIARWAAERGVTLLPVATGLGLEFADGCDVFWVLPGEPTSTLPVPAEGPSELGALLAEFERVNRLRERTLHVVRHHLASQMMSVDRRRSGEWNVMDEDGGRSSVLVGACLTVGAIEGQDVSQLATTCLRCGLLRHPPSEEQIGRYLAMEGPPVDERPIPETTPGIRIKYRLSSVLDLGGFRPFWETLSTRDELPTATEIDKGTKLPGPLGQTLLRIAELLPEPDASCNLGEDSYSLQFDDEQDDYLLAPKSRAFVERVRSLGPKAAGEEMADEFQRINVGRTNVLAAVRRAAAARRWSRQAFRATLSGDVPARWHLGSTRREVTFPVGEPLSEALRTLAPTAALRQLLSNHPGFAEECVQALQQTPPPPELPDRELSPDPPREQPPLVELDAGLIAELDAFAEQAIAAYLQRKKTIWDYGNREVFDPSCDRWATMADWISVAERHLGGQWPDPYAILILLDAGDARGEELARRYLAQAEPHYEMCEAEIEIAWRFRRVLPEVGRRWFCDESLDLPHFAETRARLGDPVARRYLATNEGFDLRDERTWTDRVNPAVLGQQPPPEVLEKAHQRLLTWARTAWQWSPPEEWGLREAFWLGLTDVADALDENPFLRPGLLCRARREEMFDEPGLLHGSEFLYLWSCLKPTELLAQIIATVFRGDVLGRAVEANREAAARNPRVAEMLDMTIQVLRRSNEDLQPPLAIAWKRYRAARG